MFSPENSDNIPSIIHDRGEFSGITCNGICSFVWTPDTITFEVAKYDDDNGGSLFVVVVNTLETMESFKKALTEWKAAINN